MAHNSNGVELYGVRYLIGKVYSVVLKSEKHFQFRIHNNKAANIIHQYSPSNMSIIAFILELLKAILPFGIAMATFYVVIRVIYDNEQDKRNVDYNLRIQEMAHSKQQETATKPATESGEVLGIRLQAYERLVLFLERINPQSLILRIRQDEMTATELQMALVISIRTEFEHNITQQLYVSPMVWGLISTSVEELITVISAVARQMSTDASGLDLSRAILQYFLNNEHTLALHQALDSLKDEAQQLF